MSECDEEPSDPMDEPLTGKEIPMAEMTPPSFRIVIEASNWDETRISDMVLNRLGERFDDKLNALADKVLATAIDAAVERVVDAKILEQAEVILREGWTATDDYGHAKKKVTFAERVHGLLTRVDSFHGKSKLDDLVEALVADALNKQLKPEVDAAKAKVQELLNGTLSAKLLQAMKEGVGLR
jgi:hypothetical protein